MLLKSCLVERGRCRSKSMFLFQCALEIQPHLFGFSICVCISREEIEKQKAKERYMKLHQEGKTDQARADLARLAIIKKQREDAAKKREEIRKGEITAQKSRLDKCNC